MQVKIKQLGHKGHGIADIDAKQVYIPFTLPGETVEVSDINGAYGIDKIIEPSASRIKPICKHFTKCGSCNSQHMATDLYDDWKKSSLEYALEQHDIDKKIDNYIKFDISKGDINLRRRVKFAAKRTKKSVMIGYHKAQSHDIIPLEECPIITKAILNILPKLADFIKPIMSRKAVSYISITDYNGKLEIGLENVKYDHGYDEITYINEQATKLNLARILINGELILQRIEVSEDFSDVAVSPVAGGFMQAVKAAELEMSKCVKQFLGNVDGNIVDLFAGIGTFTFTLAKTNQIDAFDNDKFAVEALQDGFYKAGGRTDLKLKTGTATARDLFSPPLF
ncbi:MAG: class I SAM-dependent RNA methyltransferase, partial [Rhizobiales bacterium]|nr:class I SAM-dependent RNA methyltransferase [Hyphomicrobiales bacterium]